MRAINKTILFSRVTVDKHVKRHAVAVFPNEGTAKSYAAIIATAHKSGDAEFAVSLDPATELTADKKLVPGIRFDLSTVPYSPTAGTASDDLFDDKSSPAS